MTINSNNKKLLPICMFVIISLVIIGVGYAGITAINLIINGNATASVNQNNFIVHFIEAKNITGSSGVGGTSIIESDDTKASFNVTGLSKEGDYAEAKYIVKNDSNGIGAEISLELTNSNSEYFRVTETIDNNKLQVGEETYAIVRVEMIKTPIDSDVSTSVTAKLIASPLENESAISGCSKSIIIPKEYVYTTNDYRYNTIIYQPIPDNVVKYNSFSAAKNAFGLPAVLAHIIKDGVISESYIAFEMNNKVYYLRGGVSENGASDTPIYDENKKVLKDAYGNLWSDYCTEYTDQFSCSYNGFTQYISLSGCGAGGCIEVSSTDSGKYCYVYDTRNSNCGGY